MGEILATCADDRTVMIWNATNWELYHIFDTKDRDEWHTMTYLALEHIPNGEGRKKGNRVACATQNGCVFVWSLDSKEKLWGEKMHAASIEGLVWSHHSGFLSTCASDCTANVYSFPTQEKARY